MLQEVVGEPRFGLDVERADRAGPGTAAGATSRGSTSISAAASASMLSKTLLATSNAPREGGIKWGANASDMAYILYQQPVMVGIHGREMLKNLVAPA